MAKLILLKQEKDFSHQRFRKTQSSPSFRIRIAILSQNNPRFGFIIPKKLLPKVTDRNKLKRRVKSILFKNLNSIKPLDILIFPQRKALGRTYQQLEAELIEDLKKLNLWNSQKR